MARVAEETGRDDLARRRGRGDPLRGPPGRRRHDRDRASTTADALVINADFARAMTRLVPDHLRRRWTDRKIAKQEILLLDVHALPRHRGPVRRPGPPHDLPGRGLRDEPRRTSRRGTCSRTIRRSTCRTPASPTRRSPRRARARSMSAAGDASAPERRLGARRRRDSASSRCEQLAKVGLDDVEQRIRFEKIVTPADWDQRYADPPGGDVQPGAQPRRRCSTCGRAIASRTSMSVYLVGGGTHPGSGLPVIYESARITVAAARRGPGRAVGRGDGERSRRERSTGRRRLVDVRIA